MRTWLFAGLFALCLAASGEAQLIIDIEDELDFDRPESWAMKYFASLTLLTGLGAPKELEPGQVDLQLETDWVPHLSADERRVGFQGTKVEDLNRTSVFFRPRVIVGLPHELSFTFSWIPPIEMFDVEPNLLAGALGRPIYHGKSWRLGLRGYAQYGTIKGDFTCPKDEVAAGDDPDLNPFGCEEVSSDEHEMTTLGLELSWAWESKGSNRWEPYVALAINAMDLEFQVNARYSGIEDHTLLLTDGTTLALTGGTSYRAGERWKVVGEIFYSPLDVVRPPDTSTQNDSLFNIRTLLSYQIR